MNNTADSRIIDNSRVIRHYLNELMLQQQSLLFSLEVADDEKIYTTTIQNISSTDGLLTLRMLMPADWADKYSFPTHVKVWTRLKHGQLNFNTCILHSDDSDMPSQCLMQIPQLIVKEQFRKAFRVSLVSQQSSMEIYNSENDIEFTGDCLDISLNGALCRVNSNLISRLAVGEVYEQCRFCISGILSFTCQVTLRRIIKSNPAKIMLGFSLDNLSHQQSRDIAKALVTLEREALRQNLSPESGAILSA